MAAASGVALYESRIKPWMYRWGASDYEVATVLPGDDLVQPGTPRTTRAVTIQAPAESVWPWLAQIGEGLGGFYSYDLLERAVGADIHNADAVHAEWQDVRVGDTVWLARRYGDHARMVVAAVEPNSHLVLMSPEDFATVQRGVKADGAWSFYLRREKGYTRLIARGVGGAVGCALFDVPHFVMERRMMTGIRKRAERSRRCGPRAQERENSGATRRATPTSEHPASA